jgi:hypothetical protein
MTTAGNASSGRWLRFIGDMLVAAAAVAVVFAAIDAANIFMLWKAVALIGGALILELATAQPAADSGGEPQVSKSSTALDKRRQRLPRALRLQSVDAVSSSAPGSRYQNAQPRSAV